MLTLEEIKTLGDEMVRRGHTGPANRVRLYWLAAKHDCLRLREGTDRVLHQDAVLKLTAETASARALKLLPRLGELTAKPIRDQKSAEERHQASELKLYWLALKARLIDVARPTEIVVEENELEDWQFLFGLSVTGARKLQPRAPGTKCCEGVLPKAMASDDDRRVVRCSCGRRWLEMAQ